MELSSFLRKFQTCRWQIQLILSFLNLALDVPVCLNEKPIVHGVGKGEMVDVICAVSANPKKVQFDWTFNSSAEFIRVPDGRAHTEKNGTTSKLTYTPKTDKDYGTLMCSASNEVGRQRTPCIFHIILAGKFGFIIFRYLYDW